MPKEKVPPALQSLYNLLGTLEVTLKQSTVMYEMWLNLLIFGVFAFLIQSCHASSKLPQPESWAFMSPSLNHWVLENIGTIIDLSILLHLLPFLRPRLDLIFGSSDPLTSFTFTSVMFHILGNFLTYNIPGFQKTTPIISLIAVAVFGSVWFMRINIKGLLKQCKDTRGLIRQARGEGEKKNGGGKGGKGGKKK